MTPSIPEFLHSWLGSGPLAAILLYGSIFLFVVGAAVILWFVLGPGPRRGRAFARGQRLFQKGDWRNALAIAVEMKKGGRLSALWQGKLHNLEGECHRAGGEAKLRDKSYEESLRYFQRAADLLSLDEVELQQRVVESMLAEVRRLVATGSSADRGAIQQLTDRILHVASPCPEASFWQGLGHARDGRVDLALTAWNTAHEGSNKRFLDPPLYLGALLLREGRPQESLRHLADANRIEPSCPLVTWQMGMALAAAGADPAMAARTLGRALGPRGLAMQEKSPDRLWVETLPEGRSFIRRLALKYPYQCSVLGSDLTAMLRQGQLALAQVQYRLGNFQECAGIYAALLRDRPPSVPLLRGLGLALARLEKYDEAYKHLRLPTRKKNPSSPSPPATSHFVPPWASRFSRKTRPRTSPGPCSNLAQFDVKGEASSGPT